MRLRRALAASTAAVLAAGMLAVAGSATAAPDVLDRAPFRVADGAGTYEPWGMTTDASGRLYVSGWAANKISVYAPGASSTDAPLRTIEGAPTALDRPGRAYVDPSGLLYVPNGGTGEVLVFAAGAANDVAPVRRISGFVDPSVVVAGPDGNLYVGDFGTSTVKVFAPTASGPAAPLRAITFEPELLASVADIDFSPDGSQMYLVDYTAKNRLVAVPTTANGQTSAVRRVQGAATGLTWAGGIEVDSAGRVYVADYDTEAILVFAPDAHGNAEPVTVLTGASTQLNGPWNLLLRADRTLVVGNWDDTKLLTFAPLHPLVKPVTPTVKVAGPAKNRSRTISWTDVRTPETDAVTYDVTVVRGRKRVVSKKVDGTSLTLGRSLLRKGGHQVTVTAVGGVGSAQPAKASFSVKAVKATKIRKLKVKGRSKAAKRTLRWKAPAWDGGSKLKRYRIVVKMGRTTYLKKWVKAKKRRLRVDTRPMALGRYKVTVRAKTSAGLGKKATKKFRVTL